MIEHKQLTSNLLENLQPTSSTDPFDLWQLHEDIYLQGIPDTPPFWLKTNNYFLRLLGYLIKGWQRYFGNVEKRQFWKSRDIAQKLRQEHQFQPETLYTTNPFDPFCKDQSEIDILLTKYRLFEGMELKSKSPFLDAAKKRNCNLIKILINYGEKPNDPFHDETALHMIGCATCEKRLNPLLYKP